MGFATRERVDFSGSAAEVSTALGMESDSGPCPLPGHDGWAMVGPGVVGSQLEPLAFTHDCHGREFPSDPHRSLFTMCLADAYWSVQTGRELGRWDRLDAGRRLIWTLLLAHASGALAPAPVEVPEVPGDTDATVMQAREAFALLAGLRLARMGADGLPMPFSERIVAELLRISQRQAREAIGVLRELSVIVIERRERRWLWYRPGDDGTSALIDESKPISHSLRK